MVVVVVVVGGVSSETGLFSLLRPWRFFCLFLFLQAAYYPGTTMTASVVI